MSDAKDPKQIQQEETAVAVPIPASHCDLFDRPVVVTLVTVMPDGQPQATPVWIKYDGTHLLVNTSARAAEGPQHDAQRQGHCARD